MTLFKIVIGDIKTGKSYQKVVSDENSDYFMAHKIGDKIEGNVLGLNGYELEITGGSDFCGFPMLKHLKGTGTRKILAVRSVGIKSIASGTYKRKRVAMNTINEKTSQINLKVLKYGPASLEKSLGIKKEEKTEAQKPELKEPKAKEETKKEQAAKKENTAEIQEKKHESKPAQESKQKEKA